MRYARGCRPERAQPDEPRPAPPGGPDLRRLTGSLLNSADRGLRGRAVRSLQQTAGNSSVQRLLGSASGAPLSVQRYAVGVRRTASCQQVIDWLNSRNPHRPAWAKTTARFNWIGGIVVTGDAPDFQVSISNAQVTVNTTVDMPQWSPTDPAMGSAWQAMHATLRAHEAEHEAIASQWKDTLQDRLTNLSLTVTARRRAAAQRAAQTAVQAEWRGWLVEHQRDQNAIDPFTAVLDCPAPSDEQAAP